MERGALACEIAVAGKPRRSRRRVVCAKKTRCGGVERNCSSFSVYLPVLGRFQQAGAAGPAPRRAEWRDARRQDRWQRGALAPRGPFCIPPGPIRENALASVATLGPGTGPNCNGMLFGWPSAGLGGPLQFRGPGGYLLGRGVACRCHTQSLPRGYVGASRRLASSTSIGSLYWAARHAARQSCSTWQYVA